MLWISWKFTSGGSEAMRWLPQNSNLCNVQILPTGLRWSVACVFFKDIQEWKLNNHLIWPFCLILATYVANFLEQVKALEAGVAFLTCMYFFWLKPRAFDYVCKQLTGKPPFANPVLWKWAKVVICRKFAQGDCRNSHDLQMFMQVTTPPSLCHWHPPLVLILWYLTLFDLADLIWNAWLGSDKPCVPWQAFSENGFLQQ